MSKLFVLVGLDRFAEESNKTIYHVLLTDQDKEVLKEEKEDNSHLYKSMKIFTVRDDKDLQEKLSVLNEKEKEKAFKKNTKDFLKELSEVPKAKEEAKEETTEDEYSFYLFSRLTHDLLCKSPNYAITYDTERDIILRAFNRFKLIVKNNESYYVQAEEYIKNDNILLSDLEERNEGSPLTHVCPNCQCKFNKYDFSYQVNDNTELTYCSYECSASATLKFLNSFLVNKGTIKAELITNIIHNT